jgi:hypothetical protein
MVSTFEKYFVYYCFFFDLGFDDLESDIYDLVLDLDNEKNIYNSNIDYYNKKIMDLIF